MSVSRALLVDGWMSEHELVWLADRSYGLRLVVEFGSWCGRSSIALSAAGRVLCVDTWQGSAEHAEQMASGFDPLREWCRNTAGLENVLPCEANLADPVDVEYVAGVVRRFGGADMVFIDAAHDYDSVVRDIGTARRLLVPGGLLCGHDYSGSWPGVMRAVDELVPNRDVLDTIWHATHGG